jgi:XTP/dITP diphosphohydrolase
MKILLATRNINKVEEIKEILSGLDLEILTSLDFPDIPDVIEDQDSLTGNAIKKASESAIFTGLPALADDTGLFVEALDGAPGVFSARYAGEKCTYRDNRLKMLAEMLGEQNRKAEFRTVVAFTFPDKLVATAEGSVHGVITEKEFGDNGFGYDAIFRALETGRTFGEMNDTEKNTISHRARAFRNLIPELKKVLK